MIALNMSCFGDAAVPGAARWIPLPFFQLQSSEFGKILLIVSLSAFAVDRRAGCTSAARRRGSCCWR